MFELPSIIADGMVLQRDVRVPVWGWAAEGSNIEVCFAGQNKKTRCGDQGRWSIHLDPLEASSEPAEMVISVGSESVTINNIVVGEVWLASGQSNIEISFEELLKIPRNTQYRSILDAVTRDMHNARDPLLRQIRVKESTSQKIQQKNFDGCWQENQPEHNPDFSVTAYYFARELRRELDVPVGIITSASGGTLIEPWSPKGVFEHDEVLKDYYHKRSTAMQADPDGSIELDRFETATRQWEHAAEAVITAGQTPEDKPRVYDFPNLPDRQPEALFNAMIAPLIPYAIKGVIWYQGESSRHSYPDYHEHFLTGMIKAWRNLWRQGDFPFYFAQLANFDVELRPEQWVSICDQQRRAQSVINTGMAVLNDIGEADDIHPINKMDVGKRLSLWALAKDYGKTVPAHSGPLYESCDFNGHRAIVSFSHTGSGLMAGGKVLLEPVTPSGEPLGGFEIAAVDLAWKKAEANIINQQQVEVYCQQVSEPVAVRYAWAAHCGAANLYNKEGLPCSVFKTDI